MIFMNEKDAISIRLSLDAHRALQELKETLRESRNSYSLSDVAITASLITEAFFRKNPRLVRNIAGAAKYLRLQKLREFEPVDIFEALKSEYEEEILKYIADSEWETARNIKEIIEALINDGYVDAAADVLFMNKNRFPEDEFKELSAKILEAQITLKKSKEARVSSPADMDI
ncbi:hypothetical protein [Thermococcus sp. 21S7]|uniref:hypothetical protein n=1 Tax=Thermococcus sp. 21S7 TaxID=1638221 RepID=UPI00143AD709|nr:hypothetical protein [Thermococcus sp. 21S7]NJE60516.1 hypothetical protein [Thermococcus sp. 21S7]